jgi:SpoVK/Ycf46/Vps4 family AAA+-type ATPase
MAAIAHSSGGMNVGDMIKSQLLTMTAMKGDENGIFYAIIGIIAMTIIDSILKAAPAVFKYFGDIIKKRFEAKRDEIIQGTLINTPTIKSSILFEREYSASSRKGDELVDAVIAYLTRCNTAIKLLYNQNFVIDNEEEFYADKDVYAKLIDVSKSKDTGKISSIVVQLYSYKKDLVSLRAWVNNVLYEYRIEQKNQLGDKRFFFDEVPFGLSSEADEKRVFDMMPKRMSFTMTEFNTNKSLNNVFGSHIDVVRERVDLFVNHPEWYERKGIPHTLGVLLHGPPGTGKTSLIKAIAKDTNRHIINLSLRRTTTKTQMKNLFFEEDISMLTSDGQSQVVTIPLSQRIYVIEDIDCLTDVVLDRGIDFEKAATEEEDAAKAEEKKAEDTPSAKNSQKSDKSTGSSSGSMLDRLKKDGYIISETENHIKSLEVSREKMIDVTGYDEPDGGFADASEMDEAFYGGGLLGNDYKEKKKKREGGSRDANEVDYGHMPGKKNSDGKASKHDEELTLSFILNLLDGILETPGRILIMTSNYPEKLDKALIRPGRVDINLCVSYCDFYMMKEMFLNFYDMRRDDSDDVSESDSASSINSETFDFTFDIPENEMLDGKFAKITPAEMTQILCNHFTQPYDAYEELDARIKKGYKEHVSRELK